MKPDAKQEFSTYDVMKILDLKRERLREWIKIGYAIPTKPADGPGTKAIFSLIDVYNISLFRQLVDIGLHREHAMLYVENIPEFRDYNRAKELNYIIFFPRQGINDKFMTIRDESFSFEGIDKGMPKEDGWKLGIVINYKNLRDEVNDAIRSL